MKLFVKVNGVWTEVYDEGLGRFSWLGDYSGQSFDLDTEEHKYISLDEYYN